MWSPVCEQRRNKAMLAWMLPPHWRVGPEPSPASRVQMNSLDSLRSSLGAPDWCKAQSPLVTCETRGRGLSLQPSELRHRPLPGRPQSFSERHGLLREALVLLRLVWDSWPEEILLRPSR